MRVCVNMYCICVRSSVYSNNCCRVHSNLLIHSAKMADCCTRNCNLMTRQTTLNDIFPLRWKGNITSIFSLILRAKSINKKSENDLRSDSQLRTRRLDLFIVMSQDIIDQIKCLTKLTNVSAIYYV